MRVGGLQIQHQALSRLAQCGLVSGIQEASHRSLGEGVRGIAHICSGYQGIITGATHQTRYLHIHALTTVGAEGLCGHTRRCLADFCPKHQIIRLQRGKVAAAIQYQACSLYRTAVLNCFLYQEVGTACQRPGVAQCAYG